MVQLQSHEVIVVGGGGAGLRAAIAAHEAGADTAIVTKLHPVRSHTGAAEGGINAALRDGDSWELHAKDTMKGSDFLADAPAIEVLAKDAPENVIELEHYGMPFSREEEGTVSQRPFGGLSFPRTTYAGAETGHHMLHTMYEQVVKRGIQVYDEFFVSRLAVTDEPDPTDRTCHGVVAIDVRRGDLWGFEATRGVILATGPAGQVYDHTTNAVTCTGDGQAMAYRAGVPLEDMEFVQFHPTTLPSTGVLISEGVRGEGGILYNAEGERFMFERGYATTDGELASRDVVSRAELTEINEGRGFEDEYVYLDMRHLGRERILDRLENILHLAEDFEGVDGLTEPMPVKPGQHYIMGGIETNEHGQTCIDGLYAAGECACVSVHGANRLGGNALPELIVFGRRAGLHAAGVDLGDPQIVTGRRGAVEDWDGTFETEIGAVDPEPAYTDSGVGTDVVEAAIDAEQTRIDELLDREGGVRHPEVRRTLQRAMTDHVNVFRELSGLQIALKEIRSAREAYQHVYVEDSGKTFNTDLIQAIETQNLLDVAETIVMGAIARTEFRGAHWRAGHQARDDDEWLKHTFVSWDDGAPSLWFKPVLLEGEKTYEPTIRSY